MHTDDLDVLLGKLTLAQKVRLLTGATPWRTYDEPAVGLRAMLFSDGPVGVRGERWDERDTSLALPSPTALAATFDEDSSRASAPCWPPKPTASTSTCCSRRC